jgi:hypothetical protein
MLEKAKNMGSEFTAVFDQLKDNAVADILETIVVNDASGVCGEESLVSELMSIDPAQMLSTIASRFVTFAEANIDGSETTSDLFADLSDSLIDSVVDVGKSVIDKFKCLMNKRNEERRRRRRLEEASEATSPTNSPTNSPTKKWDVNDDCITNIIDAWTKDAGISIKFDFPLSIGCTKCMDYTIKEVPQKHCVSGGASISGFSINIPFNKPQKTFIKWHTGFSLSYKKSNPDVNTATMGPCLGLPGLFVSQHMSSVFVSS